MSTRLFKLQKGDSWSSESSLIKMYYTNNDYIKYSNFSEMVAHIDQVSEMIRDLMVVTLNDNFSKECVCGMLNEMFIRAKHSSKQAKFLRDSAGYIMDFSDLKNVHSKVISIKFYQ